MKKIGIAVPVVFLFLTVYIYLQYNQAVIKGISRKNSEKLETIKEQLVKILKTKEENKQLQLDYYTLTERIIENRPTECLKMNVQCSEADPYILCYELKEFFLQKNADIFETSENSNQILFEAGRNKQKAIEILINW